MEGDEPAEDSDHDTDVIDDEEEDNDADDQHLPIPRLGSKQPSMRRQGTSQQTDKGRNSCKLSNMYLDHSGCSWNFVVLFDIENSVYHTPVSYIIIFNNLYILSAKIIYIKPEEMG